MGQRGITAIDLPGRASCAVIALALVAPATVAAQGRQAASDDTIIILGQRNSAVLRADREIGTEHIDSYGLDTVAELLDTIGREADPGGDGPVILINGQPASGIDEVADLPTEVVDKIQLLSRDAAGALGERPTRRVINVVIRPNHRQVTLGAKSRLATAGGAGQGEGTVNQLRLDQGNRQSLALRLSATDRLDEDDRDIVSPPAHAAANRFKSLLPGAMAASANGNVTRKVGRSSVSLTLRFDRQENGLRLGGLASDPPRPLAQSGDSTALNAAAIANGPLGDWRYSIRASAGWRLAENGSDRAVDPDVVDPPYDAIYRARSRTRTFNAGLSASLNGSPFTLPAGQVSAAFRVEWRGLRAASTRDEAIPVPRRHLRRDDLVGQATFQLPLFADSAIGDLGAELTGALRHVRGSGGTHDLGAALNWRPTERLTLRASIDREQSAPPPDTLTDPSVTIDNVRFFDFVRQETVFVTLTSGGNRDLGVERRRALALGASWRPIRANLNLTLDYSSLTEGGGAAPLPPLTAEVEAAFPGRFQRDGSGRLIAVDARPVAFGRTRREELRSGASFFHSFGAPPAPPTEGDDGPDRGAPGGATRINASFSHIWTLRSDRLTRAGLPLVDLLDGGAIGSGGGQPRHRLQFGAGITRGGLGLNLSGSWTGSSRVAAGTLAAPDHLRFGSVGLVDMRLFANLGTLLPDRGWAKGLRFTVSSENLFDARRRVRDSAGVTPLGYQHYLLDPLGRTVIVALRKVL